jgi:hypothetical protein
MRPGEQEESKHGKERDQQAPQDGKYAEQPSSRENKGVDDDDIMEDHWSSPDG